jgi:site-specific recombinase XerD
VTQIQLSNLREDALIAAMNQAHRQIGELDLLSSDRSLTAKNYDSSISQLGLWMQQRGEVIPTKSLLEEWKRSMLTEGKSINTVKARLSAIRKLLNETADNVTDIELKMILRDWAKIKDPKATRKQDKIEKDFGRRFKYDAVVEFFKQIDVSNVKGIRDRAIFALAVGAGLRVSEIAKIKIGDIGVKNNTGMYGVYVEESKHGVTRVVVLGSKDHWVLQACWDYANILPNTKPQENLIRGVLPLKNGQYRSQGKSLSVRAIQLTCEPPGGYKIEYNGEMVYPAFHDWRRTYGWLQRNPPKGAKAMSWDALMANYGHKYRITTEQYVGTEVQWEGRESVWEIEFDHQ